jgi:mannose-6-phosphate isomerase-like protein (cupin superfamily)
MTSEQSETAGGHPPIHRPGSADITYHGLGESLMLLATGKETNGAYAQLEGSVAPGGGPPLHIHHRADETFYLIEGSLEVRLGDSTVMVRPGDYVRVPRGTVHTFRNVGERAARMFVTLVPAGLETFFSEVFQPVVGSMSPPAPSSADLIARATQAAPQYGLELLLPPEDP